MILTTGQFDIMAEVICWDTAHFTELLTNRLQRIDGVLSTESFLVLEVHKLAYGWGAGEAGTGAGAGAGSTAP